MTAFIDRAFLHAHFLVGQISRTAGTSRQIQFSLKILY